MTYDIVMPVAGKHNGIAGIAIQYLFRNARFRNLLVITARENFGFFSNILKIGSRLRLIDEGSVIPGIDAKSLAQFLLEQNSNSKRAGWYLQQFLKMGICNFVDIADHYLIWDADTVLLKPVDFFANGKILINPATEYHAPYFETYRKILGMERLSPVSFISEHMMIKTSFMKELIVAIELQTSSYAFWVWKILHAIPREHLSSSGFSEYETYGNFVLNKYPDAIDFRPLSSCRFGAKQFGISPNRFDLFRLSSCYAYASFETWNCGMRKDIFRQKVRSLLFCMRHVF